MPKYILNGKPIEVAPEHIRLFELQNPGVKLADEKAQLTKDMAPTLGKSTDPALGTDSGSESGLSVSAQDDLGIPTPVESTSFDQMFSDENQLQTQRYTHIDENTFSSSLVESNITNREDNLKRKLEEHYKDTDVKFNIESWDGNRIEVVLPGEKKGQFFDLPSDPVEAKEKYLEMVEYMEDRTAVGVGDQTTSEIQELFDFDYKSATAETAGGGLYERVNQDKVQKILGSDYEVKESGFFKNALEITVPGGAKKTFPKSSSSEDILSFMRRNPRSIKQTKVYQAEKKKVTEEAKTDLNEAITKRLDYSAKIDGSTKRTEEEILMLLNNPESFNKMKNDILSDVTSTWWNRNKDNNDLKNLSNSDIDGIRTELVQTALDNHKANLTKRLSSSGKKYESDKGQTRESVESQQRKDHLVGKKPEEIQIAELWDKIKDPKLASEKEDNLKFLNTAQILYDEKNASNPYQFNYDVNTLSRPLVLDEKNKDIVNLTAEVQETIAAYEELPADALDGELFDVTIAHDQALREFKTKKIKVPITDFNDEVKYLTAEQKNKYIVDNSRMGLNAKGQSVLIGDRDAYFNVTAEEAASLGLKDPLLRANATFVTDLAVREEALVRLQVLNQRSTTVGRDNFGGAFVDSFAHSIGVKTDTPKAKLSAAMNDAMVDAGVTLTNKEKKLYHKQGIINGESIGEALGGLPKLTFDFILANKAAAGIQTVTGINRVLKALNAKRYAKIVNGRKIFVRPPAAIVARGETAVANWATTSGVVAKTFAPHIASRAASTAITSIIEGVKMEAVMGPGSFSTGVGFGMAGKLIPWPVIRGSNWGKTLFDYGIKSPINFTIGAEAGEIMTGLTNDVMNKKDFRDFMKEHYSDYSEVGQRTIANLVSGFAMRLSHVSKFDFKSAEQIRELKIEAKKKMDAAREEAGLQRALDPTKGEKLGPEQEAFTRAQMVYDLANRRLAEINNTELYLDPVVGPLKLANDLKGSTNKLIKDLGEKGKKIENVRVEYTDQRIKGSYRIDGKDLIYTINPKYIEPGVAPHEIGHAGMELLSGKDAILKAEVVEAIDNISKDIIMDDGRTLFESVEGVGKGDRAYDVNRVTLSEKFAYLAEAMNNPQIAKQIRKKYGFDMYGQFITKWSKKNLNADLVFNTEKRVAEWFNNYVETIGKGKSPLRNFEHSQEWISPEATTKQMKAREKWERENYRDKDGSLNSELLNKREQELTQEIDSNLKDFLDKKISKEQYKLKTEDLLKERFEVKELIAKGLPQPTEEDAKFEADVKSMYDNTAMPKGDRAFFIAEMWDPTGYTNLKTGENTRYAENAKEVDLYERTNGEQGFKAMPAGAKALNTKLKIHENVDGFAENRDLIIEDITTGTGKESKKKGSKKINKARSVRQLVLDYKAIDHPGVSLSAYVNTVLFGNKKRYLEGVNYYTAESKIGWRTSMQDAKDLAGDVNKSTYVTTEKDIAQYGDTRVVFELPINNKAFNQKGGWKETILKNLDPTKHKSFKSTPDLAPEFTREMMGVKLTKAQEAKPNDLSQKSLEGIQNFIEAKFKVEKIEVVDGVEQVKIDPKTKLPETREVSMVETFKTLLNEGAVAFDKGVSDILVGTSTGNRKTFLKEFYHEATKKELIDLGFKISEKTGRVETAAGLPPKVLNENITVEQIKRFIGIDPVTGVRKTISPGKLQDRSLAGKGRGILELFGENISKQEARLSDKLTVNQMFDMGAGRNRALLSEVLGGESFENQRSFLDKVQSENFARLLEHNKKIYPKDQQKALERTLIDHFAVEKGHDLKNSTLKTIAKQLSKEFANTKIDADKVRVAAAKQIVYTNVLNNIAPTKFELNTPEQIVEAQAVTRVVAKEMIEKYGDGIYELLFASGESGGKGVGTFPSWGDMFAGTNKGTNRLSLHEVREQAIEFMSDLKNSKGKKFTKYKKALLEGQGDKIGQMNRFIDKKTGEWDVKKLEEAFEVGEFIKTVLKDAVEVLRESHNKGDITATQVRQWVEIHGSPMTGIIKLSASFGIMPNMSVKEMFKLYPERVKDPKTGKMVSNYVLEHTTPAQYVKARIFDYIINGGGARKTALDLTLRDYHTTLIPKPLDAMVNKILQTNLPSSHLPGMDVMERYYEASHPIDFGFGLKVFAGHRKGKVYDKNITLSASEKQRRSKELREALEAAFPSILRKATKNKLNSEILNDMKDIDKALGLGRKRNKSARGMSTFDFDETVGISENFVIAKKGKKTKKIASNEWPFVGEKLVNEGWKMDFSDFNKVTKGKPGPLMQKMKNQIVKYGPENVFILTARAKESAPAIHEYLKSEGIEIPLKNITGLGDSTGEAKALWMLKKFAEGYNDMYFVDDALPNVKAVREVLDQLDIKSNVQQALMSEVLSEKVNKIMEHSLDIGSEKVFSKAEAKVRGKDIKRRRVFMRDSAADLELLIEPLYGKGKEGIKNKEWFKKEFVMPFERGIRDYNTARQSAKNDYMNLRKQNKDVVKEISKPVEGTAFTNDMAMRVYLWNKAGYKIPDLAKTTEAKLVQHIANNPKLQAYAENFARITKQEKGLKEPGENWWGETMAGEVTNINRGVSRKQYLQEWIERKNEMFTEENLNKMESKLGTEWRENITDMFDRMETGRTRSLKMDRGSAIMMNYLNGGIGTIMNFNTRSAVLQTISTTNFLNMRENNPIAAARAMGNVKQFAKDFKYIMNSDMLKQRRDGLAMNVTEAEIASAAASSQNPIQSIISKVLKAGYLPTKMADSFAISLGGATFYRNRIKMYEKQGIKTKEAEKQAFLDFQVIAERTQQSSRADLLSKQQTSLIGRFILPFANTPMQMNRAGMKDILDISKGRFEGGRELSEKIGRVSYYMGAQVAIFAGLQSALFAMLLNDDDVSEEKLANTKSMMLNTTSDSMLRGFGIQGAVLSATKNAIQEFIKQDSKPGFTADYSEVAEDLLNISPPIGSKFGMLDRAGDKKKWAKIKKNDEFKFELGNPSLEASLMTIQATTNAPVYSPYQNLFNVSHALNDQYEAWQRMLMASGWTPYSVGVETEKKKEKKKKKKKPVFRYTR